MRCGARAVASGARLRVGDRQPSVCVYWTPGRREPAALEAAGLRRSVSRPSRSRPGGRRLRRTPVSAGDLASREALADARHRGPRRRRVADARAVDRRQWLALRARPGGQYVYDARRRARPRSPPPRHSPTAQRDSQDRSGRPRVDRLDADFSRQPAALDLPAVADLAVVDDGSAATGEVMNLLSRRNLLFEVVKAPSTKYRINVALGGPDYPLQAAGDPSAFAQTIRTQLTDDGRSLRVYGSEVVIARLTGDESHERLHLINYGGRDIEGLRVKLKGGWSAGEALGGRRGPIARGGRDRLSGTDDHDRVHAAAPRSLRGDRSRQAQVVRRGQTFANVRFEELAVGLARWRRSPPACRRSCSTRP